MVVKDHMYDSRIVDIKFLPASLGAGEGGGAAGQRVISSDRHIIKVGAAGWGCGLPRCR